MAKIKISALFIFFLTIGITTFVFMNKTTSIILALTSFISLAMTSILYFKMFIIGFEIKKGMVNGLMYFRTIALGVGIGIFALLSLIGFIERIVK